MLDCGRMEHYVLFNVVTVRYVRFWLHWEAAEMQEIHRYPTQEKQHFSGKGIRQSVRRLFRETVRKQEHPCVGEYSSKPLISHWDKSVCFTFSRATEDIANTEMLHKERWERTSSLINFSIKLLRSHIWLLKRGAQLGPRCVCGNANAQWWGFPVKTAPLGCWQRYQEKDKDYTGQIGQIGLEKKVFRIKSAQLLTMESAISSDFSACSA